MAGQREVPVRQITLIHYKNSQKRKYPQVLPLLQSRNWPCSQHMTELSAVVENSQGRLQCIGGKKFHKVASRTALNTGYVGKIGKVG
jgi:hypothetical protein